MGCEIFYVRPGVRDIKEGVFLFSAKSVLYFCVLTSALWLPRGLLRSTGRYYKLFLMISVLFFLYGREMFNVTLT